MARLVIFCNNGKQNHVTVSNFPHLPTAKDDQNWLLSVALAICVNNQKDHRGAHRKFFTPRGAQIDNKRNLMDIKANLCKLI